MKKIKNSLDRWRSKSTLLLMIGFKKNVNKILPYDRNKYIGFLGDDSSIKWYGVSFQLPGTFEGDKINPKDYIETFGPLFKNLVCKIDNGSVWIVNHDDKDLKWFPNDDDNLFQLRELFKQNNITNTFKGAIIFSTDELLNISEDLLLYPFIVAGDGFLYKDLDVSHGELQAIIKISGHLNVDFLSTDKMLLKEIAFENSSKQLIIRKYNGTSLD
jgi:hypothetical protein